jgi:AcrR family transcriptional regulator
MNDADARTRLREAALELFGRRGIRETSTRAILTAAGMKNPSAINYHFGSKVELVEDLVGELIRGGAPVLQLQIELTHVSPTPSIEAWAAVAADSAADLISTERGCLLARMWWEYDGLVHPDALEAFLMSGNPVALAWLDVVATTFPRLPQYVAVARNVIMLRTLEWMIARRAARILTDEPTSSILKMDDETAFRRLMLEVALGILSLPTELVEGDVTLG